MDSLHDIAAIPHLVMKQFLANKFGTLLVKGSACNSDCVTKRFIMGGCTDKGSTASDINKHTMNIYRDYFRKGCHGDAEEASKRRAAFMDKVDATTIDAASNEICSANAAKDDLHKNLLARNAFSEITKCGILWKRLVKRTLFPLTSKKLARVLNLPLRYFLASLHLTLKSGRLCRPQSKLP